jgi:hypothetical protein
MPSWYSRTPRTPNAARAPNPREHARNPHQRFGQVHLWLAIVNRRAVDRVHRRGHVERALGATRRRHRDRIDDDDVARRGLRERCGRYAEQGTCDECALS